MAGISRAEREVSEAHRAESGHVWQGRFYSCPLDESDLWKALRYTELTRFEIWTTEFGAGS